MADEHEEWTPYQKMEAGILKDISCDTDRLIEMMEGNKMGEGFDTGALMGMLANKGVDPGIVAMLNDRCRNGDWNEGGGIWIVLLFLFLLGIGGGNGFFGNRNGFDGVAGVDRTVVNEANYSRLLDAVGTNGTRQEMAIQSLAQTLNCDCNSIKSALCSIDKELAVNQGSIVNAIQSCCCNIRQEVAGAQNAIQSQLAKCCCDTNLNIERGFCGVNSGIQGTNYLIQTTDAATRQLIIDQFCQQNAYLATQFRAIESREDQREIQNLRDQLEQAKADTREANILAAIKGTKCINARYDTTTQTVCGSVGQRNCCCNRVATATPTPTPTPATTDTVTDSIEDARMVDP